MRFATRIGLIAPCAVIALAAGPGVARAGITVRSSTIMQIGDPHYEYDFALTLDAGSQFRFGDFITIYDVRGVNGSSFHNEPAGLYTFISSAKLGSGIPGGPDYPPGVTQVDVQDSDQIFNATWAYVGFSNLPVSGVTPVPLALGEFKVQTAPGAFGDLPAPPLFTLFYASQTHDANGNAVGQIGQTTPSFVPEPSSYVLIGSGAVSLWLVGRVRRRRG